MTKKVNPILKKITAEAKRIRKAHPNMKWHSALKDAAKNIKSGAKTVVKKSAAVKKSAVKKLVVKKSAVKKSARKIAAVTPDLSIGSVMSTGKKLMLHKLGVLEAKKYATKLKRDKNKISKEIIEVKKTLRKFL
jgi:hypothetical protein